MPTPAAHLPAGASLLLFVLGLLLFLEVVRPFRAWDLDYPMGYTAWGLGAALAAAALWFGLGSTWLNVTALVLNSLVLVFVLTTLLILKRSWRLF